MVERVYVDMESSRIGAIVAAAGFRRLLEGAMVTAESCAAVLLSEDDAERLKVWSWWRRGRVSRYLKHNLIILVAAGWTGVRIPGYHLAPRRQLV